MPRTLRIPEKNLSHPESVYRYNLCSMPAKKTTTGNPALPAYAIILAGGYGTRFWPVSRRARPKQFLPLSSASRKKTGKPSLLQQTVRRLPRSFSAEHIFVVGNAEHKNLLHEELPGLRPGHILLEPVARNTAAAIALAAEHIRAALPEGEDALLAVFPADHAIADESGFRRVVRSALRIAAAEETMVVLGIPPTETHTGYGYIERGFAVKRLKTEPVFAVRRFTEKPDPRTAARYLRSKRYFWNAGMFFWRLSFLDRMLKEHLPRTRAALRKLSVDIGRADYDGHLNRIYPKLENISVDYALAEPVAAAGQARVLAADIGWSDLGSWSSIYDWLESKGKTDGQANLIPGESFTLDSEGNLIQAGGKFVAAIGVKNMIIVETEDAILVCPRDRAQEVGEIVKQLKRKQQQQLL